MHKNQQNIYLSDSDLIKHCQNIGSPLPFSVSSLRKDRLDGRLGGVPFRKIGGAVIYCPLGVFEHLAGQQVIQPKRHPAIQIKPAGRRGRPKKTETVLADKLHISVPELRLMNGGVPA